MRHKEYLKNIGQKISKIDQETKMKLTEGKALKVVHTWRNIKSHYLKKKSCKSQLTFCSKNNNMRFITYVDMK